MPTKDVELPEGLKRQRMGPYDRDKGRGDVPAHVPGSKGSIRGHTSFGELQNSRSDWLSIKTGSPRVPSVRASAFASRWSGLRNSSAGRADVSLCEVREFVERDPN